MNNLKRLIALCSLLLTAAVILPLQSAEGTAVPQQINYRGTLTDPTGNPVPDGNYSIVFTIYDAPTDGSPLWTETWNPGTVPVPTVNGIFNISLGSHTPIPIGFFQDSADTWLGMQVGADPEMLPRQKITSVGYAFTAGNGIPPGGIIMFHGAVIDIPAGWALCDGTSGTPDLRDKFILGSGGTLPGSGGAVTHSHGIVGGSASTNSTGAHTHSVSGSTSGNPTGFNANPRIRKDSDENYMGHHHSITGTAASGGNHTHTVSGNTEGTSGLPPYYALAFIMKL